MLKFLSITPFKLLCLKQPKPKSELDFNFYSPKTPEQRNQTQSQRKGSRIGKIEQQAESKQQATN